MKYHSFHLKGIIFPKLALGEIKSATSYRIILEKAIWLKKKSLLKPYDQEKEILVVDNGF